MKLRDVNQIIITNFAPKYKKETLLNILKMRKIRLIVLAVFAAVSMSASAQEPFGTFYFQYNLTYLKSGEKTNLLYNDKERFNQLTLGYNYATPLFSIPLFLEFGGAFQWAFKSGDGYKANILALKAPINLVFSLDVSDDFKIQPYGGFYGRVNLLAKTKPDEAESINWFDHPSVDAKRFQVGVNAGLRFTIGQSVTIGAGYYRDLMDISKARKAYFEGWDFTIGMVI